MTGNETLIDQIQMKSKQLKAYVSIKRRKKYFEQTIHWCFRKKRMVTKYVLF